MFGRENNGFIITQKWHLKQWNWMTILKQKCAEREESPKLISEQHLELVKHEQLNNMQEANVIVGQLKYLGCFILSLPLWNFKILAFLEQHGTSLFIQVDEEVSLCILFWTSLFQPRNTVTSQNMAQKQRSPKPCFPGLTRWPSAELSKQRVRWSKRKTVELLSKSTAVVLMNHDCGYNQSMEMVFQKKEHSIVSCVSSSLKNMEWEGILWQH